MPIVVNGQRFDGKIEFEPFEPVVYETVRTYCRKPFMLEEHVKRLSGSARIVGIDDVPSVRDLEKVLMSVVEEIDGEVYYKVYLRPNGDVIVEYTKAPDDVPIADLEFSKYRKSGLIPPQLKVVGRTDVMLARIGKRTYDVLMLNEEGYLAEGSFSSVFLIKDGEIITPSIDTGILSGITREVVLEVARKEGFPVQERLVHPWEVFEADEMFLTHTSRGIVPVGRVSWKNFEAHGEVTGKLMEAFNSFVRGNC